MISRDELEKFLADLYCYDDFKDYCSNGLVVEGKDSIKKIILGVSFNRQLIEEALKQKADAIIVHHGIFNKGFFVLRGYHKTRVKELLDNDISLFGIHLPMDAHPVIGHNIKLMGYIKCSSIKPFANGFSGKNNLSLNIEQILKIFHDKLQVKELTEKVVLDSPFSVIKNKGFTVLANGPALPKKITVISGASAEYYESAVALGTDTFIAGEIREHIPAISKETGTNYINLGHYYSEKPGMFALQSEIQAKFDVVVEFIDIPNPV